MSAVGLVQRGLGVGQAQAGDSVKVLIRWFDWSHADLANCSHIELNRWSRRFWRNCRGHRIYTVSSSSYLHTLRQLASHLDWREPIGLQERLKGRSSHNGEFYVMSRDSSKGNPVSSMAESGTIADIQVSVRQITQQSLVSRWYEMCARSSQSLLSSDWTLASKMVGRGGWKARRLSLRRTPALFPFLRLCFFHRGRTKGSDTVSVNKAPAFKNSKSGLRCATEEPMFKSVCLS